MTSSAIGEGFTATWQPIPNGTITIGGTYVNPGWQVPVQQWGIASGANATWNPNYSPSSASLGFQVNGDFGADFGNDATVVLSEDEMEMALAVGKWQRHFGI